MLSTRLIIRGGSILRAVEGVRSYSHQTCLSALSSNSDLPLIEVNCTGSPSPMTPVLKSLLSLRNKGAPLAYEVVNGTLDEDVPPLNPEPSLVIYPDCFHELSEPTPRRFMRARALAGIGGRVVLIWRDNSVHEEERLGREAGLVGEMEVEEGGERERKIDDVWEKFEHFLGNYFGSPKSLEGGSSVVDEEGGKRDVVHVIPVIA
ncbi:hypothetical protein TrRE_jg7925 [Triparma retinervis]|uniref:Uncharacterized protein n=1 Tax=Triparma retinervis TaxID=2557542 RepID=A0A9W6ZCB3_9STRA|nr:hypothetical protein TrRE_jg7925 [Triparma retinervis]